MKKLIIASAAVAAMSLCAAALAGGPDAVNAQPKGQVVFGGDLGYSWSKSPADQPFWGNPAINFSKFSDSRRGLAFGGHVGYRYSMMPQLSVGAEAGYLRFAPLTSKGLETADAGGDTYTYKIKSQAITFLGVVDYHFAKYLNVFAKGGPAYVIQNTSFDYYNQNGSRESGNSNSNKTHAVRPFVSVGTGVTFDHIEFDVAYDHLFGSAPSSKDAVVQAVPNKTKLSNRIASQNAVMASLSYNLPV